MAWATITSLYDGSNKLDDAALNQFKDNMEALRAPASYIFTGYQAYTTTNTVWTEIDSTNLTKTLTTTGGFVLVMFEVEGFNLEFDIEVDGTRLGTPPSTTGKGIHTMQGARRPITVFRLLDLAAGNHTFKPVYKAIGAVTATIETQDELFWAIRELN